MTIPPCCRKKIRREYYVVRTGVNSTDKRPFKPILLLVLLVLVVTGFSLLSQVLARWAGVY